MLTKLQRYSSYLNLSRAEKLKFVATAGPEEASRGPIPGANDRFSEEDFVHLNVFDSERPQTLYKLKTYRQKADKPKAVVALFHGLTSHLNRGAHLAKYFATKNIETVGIDFRGFGKSQGLKGYVQDAEFLVSDTQKFMGLVKQIYPNLPIYGAGLSMGGGVVYHLSRRNPSIFDGTILMAPALMPAADQKGKMGLMKGVLNTLQLFLPNSLRLFSIDADSICRNPNYHQYNENDHLFQKERIRMRTLSSLLAWLDDSSSSFPQYNLPFLVIQGGRDNLVDPQVAFELIEKTKTPEENKDILFYEKMLHDVWHEPQINQIQEKMAEWVLQRANKVQK